MATILIVEDSKPLNALMTELLKTLGHTLLSAYDGKEGLTKLEEGKDTINLLFSDIQMPELNGLDMIKTILDQQEKYPSIPMIICSTEDQGDLIKSYEFPPQVHWTPKPFKLGKVKILLEELGIT